MANTHPSGYPQELIDSFNAIVRERGGGSAFSDYQLDLALLIAQQTRDVLKAGPMERVKIAESIAKLLQQLPPIVPVSDRSKSVTRDTLAKMNAVELSATYASYILDDNLDIELDAEIEDAKLNRVLDAVFARRTDPDVPIELPPEARTPSWDVRPAPVQNGQSIGQPIAANAPTGAYGTPERPIEEACHIQSHAEPPTDIPPLRSSSPAERDGRLRVFSYMHLKDDDPRRVV